MVTGIQKVKLIFYADVKFIDGYREFRIVKMVVLS